MNRPPPFKKVDITFPVVAATTTTTVAVDTEGFDYAVFLVHLGAIEADMSVLKVQESDDSGMSGAVDVAGTIYGTSAKIDGVTSALPTAAAVGTGKSYGIDVDLIGRKRYLDLVATFASGTSNEFCAECLLFKASREEPVTMAQRNLTQIVRA